MKPVTKNQKMTAPTPIVQIYSHSISPSLPITTHVGVLVTIGKQEWYCQNSPDYNIPFKNDAYEQRFGKPEIITLSMLPPNWSDNPSSKISLLQKIQHFIDNEAKPKNYCLHNNNCSTTAAKFLSDVLGYKAFDRTTILPSTVTNTAKTLSIVQCINDLWQYCKDNSHRIILYNLDDLFDKTGNLKQGQTWTSALKTLDTLCKGSKRQGIGRLFNGPSTRATKLSTLMSCIAQQHPVNHQDQTLVTPHIPSL